MISIDGYNFFDQEALLDRLTAGLKQSSKQAIFVVGAPLTAPFETNPGVADVRSVVAMIRKEFEERQSQLAEFDRQVGSAQNSYQAAFQFLEGRRGPDGVAQIIRRAVWDANLGKSGEASAHAVELMQDEELNALDDDINSWSLGPGVEALGELISKFPAQFGRAVVTSNFDPLLQVSIRKAGGQAWRTALYADGNLDQSRASGCQVIHIHGFWHGSDTLHTGLQLVQQRPTLKSSLLGLLAGKVVVVIAYGGWRDIFTEALESMIADQGGFPQILWCFLAETPNINHELKAILEPGIRRGRVTLYAGVDCHLFLPQLAAAWKGSGSPHSIARTPLRDRGAHRKLECDRPPSIEAWVGRDAELRALEGSAAKVVAICGFGGEGKSVLVAKHLEAIDRRDTEFSFWDWRDCREEGDRLRTQLLSTIERCLGHQVRIGSEQGYGDSDLIELFVETTAKLKGVFVFDNVDSYVDLEKSTFSGLLDELVKAFCRANSTSRLILTCRPTVTYDLTPLVTLSLKGLSIAETEELFAKRDACKKVSPEEIETAHAFTNGHAFWLDLMALQVARVPGVTLKKLMEDIRRGRDDTPDVLSSIWGSLPPREKTLLYAMAEFKRPESEKMIEAVVSGALTYAKFRRSMKQLIILNLIVVKKEVNAPDLYDLHPLVKRFIINNFGRRERNNFIEALLKQYVSIIKGIGALLGVHLSYSMLERWSQKAELELEAGHIQEALITLSDATDALVGSGHTEEFVRVARKLFESVDWVKEGNSLKWFDDVLRTFVSCLTELEQLDDADDVLRRYEDSISAKTARYINLCDARCFSYWLRGEFTQAMEWGLRGDELKKSSQVDTAYDCAHSLALAKRDSGDPEGALPIFLKSNTLDKLLGDHADASPAEGAVYGNVGRCLQKMDRLDDALFCLKKSAALLEKDESAHRMSNQAYARQWIGEMLYAKGQKEISYCFLLEAENMTRQIAPARARKIKCMLDRFEDCRFEKNFSSSTARKKVESWMRS